jgi:hypothetical protein
VIAVASIAPPFGVDRLRGVAVRLHEIGQPVEVVLSAVREFEVYPIPPAGRLDDPIAMATADTVLNALHTFELRGKPAELRSVPDARVAPRGSVLTGSS